MSKPRFTVGDLVQVGPGVSGIERTSTRYWVHKVRWEADLTQSWRYQLVLAGGQVTRTKYSKTYAAQAPWVYEALIEPVSDTAQEP